MGELRGSMLRRPAFPMREIAVLLHESAKKRVVGQPDRVVQQEAAKLSRPRGILAQMLMPKKIKGGLQQGALERLGLCIFDTARAQFRLACPQRFLGRGMI